MDESGEVAMLSDESYEAEAGGRHGLGDMNNSKSQNPRLMKLRSVTKGECFLSRIQAYEGAGSCEQDR